LGFTSTLEIIVKLKLLGCSFSEIPFVLRYDKKIGESKMVGSITTLGYLAMAIMYHWPIGGWKSRYCKINKIYNLNRLECLRIFSKKENRLTN
jgi:dolichol-phosphate mannosyltransferase